MQAKKLKNDAERLCDGSKIWYLWKIQNLWFRMTRAPGQRLSQHQAIWWLGLSASRERRRTPKMDSGTCRWCEKPKKSSVYSNLIFADYSSELSFPWRGRFEAVQLLHNIKLYAGMFMEGQNLQVIFLNIQSDSCSTGSRKDVWLSAVEYSLWRWVLNVLGCW